MSYIEAYHGTNNVKKVLQEGIRLGKDWRSPFEEGWEEGSNVVYRGPAIFLTNDLGEARHYGSAVVKVRIPTSWIVKTEYGKEHGFGFLKSRWYIVGRPIPANCIIDWQFNYRLEVPLG